MRVPATKPYFFDEDIEFILENFEDILRGKSFLSMWKYGEELEAKFAEYIGTRYAVACNSGTSALELIFRGLNVDGKEVILPSNTFIATANAILNAGGKLVFADCGANMCLDYDDVISRVTPNTAAICQVHIGGIVSQSTPALAEYCANNDLHFVEDAAQAHGSSLGATKAGAFAAAAGFSFFSTKVMTTGEGGIVTTDDAELVERMKSGREFGKEKSGIFTNYHTSLGYNWRMPEVAALLGLRQLKALPKFLARRQEVAAIYDDALEDCDAFDIVRPEANSVHNYFKYIVVLKQHDRAAIHKALEAEGVAPSGYVYELPLHKQPVFEDQNNLCLPVTERVCAKHICLPVFYGITDEQVRYVATTLKTILQSNGAG
jgi:dTDP-4-amino-4,6-dideoxygalactose transaminase